MENGKTLHAIPSGSVLYTVFLVLLFIFLTLMFSCELGSVYELLSLPRTYQLAAIHTRLVSYNCP